MTLSITTFFSHTVTPVAQLGHFLAFLWVGSEEKGTERSQNGHDSQEAWPSGSSHATLGEFLKQFKMQVLFVCL